MEAQSHQFNYCHADSLARYVYVPEHDDFIDGLGLNPDAKLKEAPVEASDVATLAVPLESDNNRLSNSIIPMGDCACKPICNVYYLEDYRNGGDHAA